MKKIFGYITLAMALTACGSDEALQEYEHQQDKYPLQFTATVEDGTETRVTADNKWSNGDVIGIQIGTDEKQQGMYTYAANDGGGTWSSEKPVSWQEGQTADVTAWYPYGKENENISNQADGYTQYEFLKAEETGQSSQQTVELTFKHQMAKVQCRVMDNNLRLIKGANVRFYGMPSVTFDKGAVTATGTRGAITPYSIDHGDYTTYVALLAPQTIASGESFIEVTANGKTYHFKPTDNIKLEAGKSHNYSITIGDVNYTTDDNGIYHVYTAEGLTAWAKAANTDPYKASCILENDITMPATADGGSNWTPISIGFKGTFDGNSKIITGLVVNSTESSIGFIRSLSTYGMVKNLTLEAATITGSTSVGAVVGLNNGAIENCHVTGASVITGSGSDVGGVVGKNSSKISACHVAKDCSVKGNSNVGGIAGERTTGGDVIGCYALCSLEGNSYIGGIIGYANGGSYTACYSKCSYSSGSKIGGIVGLSNGTPTFKGCYWQGDGNCTKGVGNADSVPQGITQATDWSAAATAMNSVLDSDFGYQYKANGSSQTEPLKLVKKQ